MNDQIRVPEVRVIDQDNQQIGVISISEALSLAREANLDLVEVAPKSVPPVCRVMDYGKWRYDQKKKDHKARQKQHQVVIKEVRLRPKIDSHDQAFKMKKAREFLEKGNKVQFSMLFRGREMVHLDLALQMFQDIAEQLQDLGKVEVPARRLGRRMNMMVAPEIKLTAGHKDKTSVQSEERQIQEDHAKAENTQGTE